MLMLSHASEVKREDLIKIATPAPTDTWRPIPHHQVVNTLLDRARMRGLCVKSERYAVLPGAIHVESGVQIPLLGARMFGSLDFEPIQGVPFPVGCTPSAGIRNSHDKTFALSILSGARVMVCANGVLHAEHIVSRKHTSGIELKTEIDRALDAFMDSIKQFRATYERLKSARVSKAKAHSLIVEMARAGAFPSSHILPVVQEFEHPRHDEFRDSTAWSLYNAATEKMKDQSPGRQAEAFKGLNAVLMALLN